jgi:putative hemolysin
VAEAVLSDPGGEPRLPTALILPGSWQLIVLPCLFLIIYAFYAAFEAGVAALDDHALEEKAESGSLSGKLLLKETKMPGRFISRIRAARIVYLALYAIVIADGVLKGLLPRLSAFPGAVRFLLVLALLVLAFLLLYVLGDLLAKQQGRSRAEAISYRGIYLYRILTLPILPLSMLGTVVGSALSKLFKLENMEVVAAATEEDLRMMLSASKEAGHIEEQDKDLIENIFDFDDKNVAEIMTHRTDISAFSVTDTYDQVMELVTNDQYTRYPVYDDSIDNIVGFVHVKDILNWLYEKKDEEFDLTQLMRKPSFTPETRNLRDLFQEMQHSRAQMVVVIDEYGGTAGLVTLEDIVEEIVGEIEDEYDEEEIAIVRLTEDSWMLHGTAELEDVEEACQLVLPKEDFDTVAGMIIGHLDRIPEEGENPEIVVNGGRFRVESVQDNRITLVHLRTFADPSGKTFAG